MGAWDVGITANDTAMDLRSEYTCASYYYKDDIETALKKLDDYFFNEFSKDPDEEEVCGYYYSLADFMWKKGILTEGIKKKVPDMIDSGYGLELWAESGDNVLKERKKALDKFREMITSPMGAVKKIKPDFNMKDIFADSDLIAIQLQTKGKQYVLYKIGYRYISPEDFEAFDGKYVLIQKIYSEDWGNSQVVPELHDYIPYFRLLDGVYDDIPEITDISNLKDANIYKRRYQDSEPCLTPCFMGNGGTNKISFYRKHNYKIIGNFPVEQKYIDAPVAQELFFSDKLASNAESEILSAMGDKEELKLPGI